MEIPSRVLAFFLHLILISGILFIDAIAADIDESKLPGYHVLHVGVATRTRHCRVRNCFKQRSGYKAPGNPHGRG